jgi:hypothetical protein
MANINDYMLILKELNKILNSMQYLIGPNISEDILNIMDGINTVKLQIDVLKAKLQKRNHFLKNRKRNKK